VNSREIREKYLRFFEGKGHTIIPSSSLIPFDDPTLLFTSAGMVQFKKFWITEGQIPYTRAVSCQKCLRAGGKDSDLENIGKTGRHHTFFEMLGNFSFGDYFKKEAIEMAWEFVIEQMKIEKQRIWASYYCEDIETLHIWKKFLPEDKIVPLGKKDNFWGPAGETGPCGPCSEIYIDFGKNDSCKNPDCKPGCDCDRFLEFWNLVFPQYNQQLNGQILPLKKRGVDTGMGLERIARIMQNTRSNYETDLFLPLLQKLEEISKVKYSQEISKFRIIVDHIRAAAFILSDGVYPNNEGRGYILRRIIRRASFQGNAIGLKRPFLSELIDPLIAMFEGVYENLKINAEEIKITISEEEKKFLELLSSARKIFDTDIEKIKDPKISGDMIFRWYDTYGIPRDLIAELTEEKHLTPDWQAFEEILKHQQEKTRQKSVFEQKRNIIFESDTVNETIFTGYVNIENNCIVKCLYFLPEKELWELIVDRTPFYPEKGGQVGDKGIIKTDKWSFSVIDCQIDPKGVIYHIGRFASGTFQDVKIGQPAVASVSRHHRMDVSANHTATHLLHYCLRKISNNQAKQAGSYVDPEKFRFDFIFPLQINNNLLQDIETNINKLIFENYPVFINEMDYNEAIKKGSIALFTEKYGEKVRVIDIGNFHAELCGGTHVSNTSEIGIFKIVSFSSVGENLKRIEAVTRKHAYDWFNKRIHIIDQASSILKTTPENLVGSINKIKKQIQDLEKKLSVLTEKAAMDIPSTLERNRKNMVIKNTDVSIIAGRVDGLTTDQLGKIADGISSNKKGCIVFLAGEIENKVAIVCKVSADIADIAPASSIIKYISKILGGKGGGKSHFAQGLGKDTDKIDDIISKITELIPEAMR